MTKFFFKLKKKNLFLAHFPNFSGNESFSQKLRLCHVQLHKGFQHHAKIQRNLIIEFEENTWTDGSTEERTDPIALDPSSYHRGSNKCNCSRLAFKSQMYGVRCLSNKKLLHHSQYAKKNQLNSYSFLRYSRFGSREL